MIEIEKKFLLSGEQQQLLLEGATELGEKLVTDSYFDTKEYRLTTNDFWFRERDGAYELKKPLQSNGSTSTNRYRELTDEAEIAQALDLDEMVDLAVAIKDAGIDIFMTCYSKRKSYEKQGFRIDIDFVTFKNSSFEYAIAEIELLIKDESEADDAEARIINFAHQFNLATDQVILGKGLAFLKSEAPEHYEALVTAGVIK